MIVINFGNGSFPNILKELYQFGFPSFMTLWASLSASDFALLATTGQDDPTGRDFPFCRIYGVRCHTA
jgi:hypothetical protein